MESNLLNIVGNGRFGFRSKWALFVRTLSSFAWVVEGGKDEVDNVAAKSLLQHYLRSFCFVESTTATVQVNNC